jgi:hypothetical protein
MADAPSEEAKTQASPRGRLAVGLWAVVGGCLGGALVTWAVHDAGPKAEPGSETVVTTVREGPSVIVAIRALSVLQTSSYHIERVIDLRDTQTKLFGLVKSQDAMLLVAAGDVVAGLDLAEIRDTDVTYDVARGEARIVLPPVRILSARLDNDRTYVHSRTTGALAERAESLETRARQEAERTLRNAALNAGILAHARASAVHTLESLLGSLGYTDVKFDFREE